MDYDSIKLLHLEDINIDYKHSWINKTGNYYQCYIRLLKSDNYVCPNCGSLSNKVKEYYEKKISHSSLLDYEVIIRYSARRLLCNDCHKSFYEPNPFCETYSKISYLTTQSVLLKLKDFHSTFSDVAKQYFLSTSEVIRIFDKYVDCGRGTLTPIICVDEFYLGKKSRQKYAFVIMDFNTSQIIDVLYGRHKNILYRYFDGLLSYKREIVKWVCMDMYQPYIDVFSLKFPNAHIAVDSFHVIQHLNNALIEIRIKTMKKYDNEKGNLNRNDTYYSMLKHFHYFLVKDYDKIYSGLIKVPRFKTKWYKDQILNYLLSIDEDLTAAYKLKEMYRDFNKTAEYNEQTREQLRYMINEFKTFKFKSYRDFGDLLAKHEDYILNSFIRIEGRRLSNGPCEGLNSRIKTILKNACGYTKFPRLRNKIIYSLNKYTGIKF